MRALQQLCVNWKAVLKLNSLLQFLIKLEPQTLCSWGPLMSHSPQRVCSCSLAPLAGGRLIGSVTVIVCCIELFIKAQLRSYHVLWQLRPSSASAMPAVLRSELSVRVSFGGNRGWQSRVCCHAGGDGLAATLLPSLASTAIKNRDSCWRVRSPRVRRLLQQCQNHQSSSVCRQAPQHPTA